MHWYTALSEEHMVQCSTEVMNRVRQNVPCSRENSSRFCQTLWSARRLSLMFSGELRRFAPPTALLGFVLLLLWYP